MNVNSLALLFPRYAVTGIRRLARNTVTAMIRPRNGWSPPPVLVTLNPTEECNLRCKMCFERGANMATATWGAPSAARELTMEDYRAFLGEAAAFSPTFYITGGEPLVSDKTIEIIREIKARGFYASMNTNGVLLKEHARHLVESGLDRIIVSLDGPKEVHNAIRGDTFDRVAEGIALLERWKREQRTRVPALRAQCVISPYNAGRLNDAADAAKKLGLPEIRFQHLMFAFSEASFSAGGAAARSVVRHGRVSSPVLRPGDLDVAALTWEVESLRHRPAFPRVRFEPDIRSADLKAYYEDPRHPFRNDCLSPWRRLVVSAGGDMGPCRGMDLGRYPEQSILEAWLGARFRQLRGHVLESGLFPHCLRCCHRQYYGQRIGLCVE